MPEPTAHAADTVTLDTSPSKAMTLLYGAAIGPIGSDYYLPIFERFEAAGHGTLSWNWSACLYNLNWMLFRGLWGAALVAAGALAGAALVLVALGRLVFDWPPELLYGLLLACVALVFLVPGAWGNALLYNHSRAAMMTAVANNKTLVQACAELSQHASSRLGFIRIVVVNLTLMALAGLAYVMLADNNAPARPEPEAAPALASASSPVNASSAASAAVPAARVVEAVASAVKPAASEVAPVASAPAAVASSAASATSTAARAQPAALAPASASAPAPEPEPAPAPAPVSASASASSPAVVAPAMALSKEVKSSASAPAPAPHIKAKLPVSAPAPTEGFYVNAGLFADPDNARRTQARLVQVGLPATAQELHTSHGARTRVRVGPFPNRNRAELAVRHIKAMNLDAELAKP